jgi:hypothetical protein
VNEFVEKCRTEWKRLGVPDPVADEMAAELTADLEEAKADGTSADEVLGAGALDPPAFAAAWATERGVTRRPLVSSSGGLARRSLVPVAIAVFALSAFVGAALVIFSPSSSEPLVLAPPPSDGASVRVDEVERPRIVVAGGRLRAMLGSGDSGFDAHIIGSAALIAGLAGLVLLSMWAWVAAGGRGGRERRPV